MPSVQTNGERVFHGIAVSPGVCQGRVVVLGKTQFSSARKSIPENQVPAEVRRFKLALVATRQQILDLQHRLTQKAGAEHAAIFEAHLLVIDDPEVNNEVLRFIEKEKVGADFAYQTVTERYAASLAAVDDEYLRERAADLRDIASRVLNNLLGRSDDDELPDGSKEPCIVVAHDLAPSQTAQLHRDAVLGFATDVGSRTSHTAIMARSMHIPAVVGLKTIATELSNGDHVLLDGINGVVIVNPTDKTLYEYGQLAKRQQSLDAMLLESRGMPAITLDNHRVILSGNIEHAEDSAAIRQNGAEGVGLFRTEYLFLNHKGQPSEQEQFEFYKAVAATLKPDPVVIRTLDLGGDKMRDTEGTPETPEENPFLGWRAIRYCLEEKDIFRTQLRAILRASSHGNIKVMYPMVSGLDELIQANALFDECKAGLRREKVPFNENIECGIMIETPSAALIADSLAKRAKFFSLGTNDLIQYSLAVDRTNEKVAHLYEPTHPAIIRLIKITVDAAHKAGIWAGVCGEMAGDPVLVPLLLGLGVDELSAAPPTVPRIKFLIRRLKISEARELAEFALQCESSLEILERCRRLAAHAAPEIFPELA